MGYLVSSVYILSSDRLGSGLLRGGSICRVVLHGEVPFAAETLPGWLQGCAPQLRLFAGRAGTAAGRPRRRERGFTGRILRGGAGDSSNMKSFYSQTWCRINQLPLLARSHASTLRPFLGRCSSVSV